MKSELLPGIGRIAAEWSEQVRHRPLAWLACWFIAGVLLAGLMAHSTWIALPALACGLALLFVLPRRAWVAIGLIGLGVGAIRYETFTACPPDDISRLISPAPMTLEGTVSSDPDDRPGRTLFLLDCRSADTHAGRVSVRGTAYVMLTGYAREDSPALSEGDHVSLDGILEEPAGATNPGAFSWRDYLARRAIWCEMRVKRPGAVRIVNHAPAGLWLNAAWRVRHALIRAMRNGLAPQDQAVLAGILLGRRADLPPQLMADFVTTGTVHILATAGLHVGIVSILLMGLFARVTLPRKLSAVLTIASLWLYALMAGGRPSVTRAALMASLYFGAVLFERAPDLFTSLAAAALLVLWLQPTALFEPAFQMSFLTVLGLILLMPVWAGLAHERLKGLRGWRRVVLNWGWELMGLSLFAQLAASPIVAEAYNQISVLGIFANLCAVPMLFVLLPAGFLAAACGCVSLALGGALFRWLVAPILHVLVAVVIFFAHLPGCSLSVASLPAVALLGYYGLLYVLPLVFSSLARARRGAGAAGPGAAAGAAATLQPAVEHDGA